MPQGVGLGVLRSKPLAWGFVMAPHRLRVLVSFKIYDKMDDFYLEIVNFPFLDGAVTRSPSYCVYISQPS